MNPYRRLRLKIGYFQVIFVEIIFRHTLIIFKGLERAEFLERAAAASAASAAGAADASRPMNGTESRWVFHDEGMVWREWWPISWSSHTKHVKFSFSRHLHRFVFDLMTYCHCI